MRRYHKHNPAPPYHKEYMAQRLNAKNRSIPFLLTFEHWLVIWVASGNLPNRGKGSGTYCMARHGDKGAYEVGNVSIVTNEKNIQDFERTPEYRAKIGAASKALVRTPQHRARISKA